MVSSDEKLNALLKDLNELSTYLHERGEHSLVLAQRFTTNAQKDAANREFDLNQARMLDYQHKLFHEVGNLVDKIVKQYET
jgi:hypothetical protein